MSNQLSLPPYHLRPNHKAEMAAEHLLLASATILRSIHKGKPIQIERHLKRMTTHAPHAASALLSGTRTKLDTLAHRLGQAYEEKNSSTAQKVVNELEALLHSLCH
jgi:hypothetical protein